MFWVALDAETGELLGTSGVCPLTPEVFELRKMYLSAASRGLGIGQRLLVEGVEWTKARGGKRLVLDT